MGGGFGGAYCAQTLERRLRPGMADVLLLDRNNYFTFYPLLMEAGTGSLEPRHAVVPIRSFLRHTAFRMGQVEAIDFERRLVRYRLTGSDLVGESPYDHLVLALGSVTRWPQVPGLREYACQMKTLGDAVALRDRAIRLLEWADAVDDPNRRRALLHFVVVGANFSGIEVAGELDVSVRKVCRSYPNIRPEQCSITLVEIADRVLPILDQDLSAYATKHLRRRGIRICLKTSVSEVRPDTVVLSTGEELPAYTLIWCAGIEPNPLVRQLGLPTGPKGHVLCERDLRVRGFDNVWAIGDCASIPDPHGQPYPPTAQHAVREGYHLAANLARVLAGKPPTACDIVSKGALVALGCHSGVGKVYGYKVAGLPAWFLWRTVYLMKMPGLARKVKVALDWTLGLFFPHEHVQLGIHRGGDDSVTQ